MNLSLFATSKPLGPITGTGKLNPGILTSGSGDTLRNLFNNTISSLLGFLTMLAALYFLFQIVISGYGIISAGGDTGQVAENRTKLTNGILGLTIIVASYAIIGLIGRMFGINIFNPLIQTIFP